ncbi:hypothetical protein SFC43_00190 [Bacteroides sp. CR5/BHMF/2]|nr:hypothetical protein [Bacteroides sp. CR5/BHMF/2]
MNYYNGLLDLDIPLFDYKDTAFELDMSIKYISDGFKPGRRPSMVGNNWILNVGGSITRNVMGSLMIFVRNRRVDCWPPSVMGSSSSIAKRICSI